ncbi:hypothetical protein KRP22_006213 [Phytophthora ramorum]|nr:Phosphatidylinositol polyphosphate 5-phosphatase type IV [Phytophthora ramorum]
MPLRANNRVGVEVDPRLQKAEEEPHGNSSRDSFIDGEASPTARGMRSISSVQSLEDAKAQRQKELLRKKKAERRAHAKERAAEKQQRQDEKKQKRELLQMLDEDVPAPEPTKVPTMTDPSTSTVCKHEDKWIEQARSNRDLDPALKAPRQSQEEIAESLGRSLAAIGSDEGILQPTVKGTSTQRSLQDSDYPSTTEIVPKKVQKHSQSAKSANAAALTIQKALKKKYKKYENGRVETGIYADPDEIGEWPQELDLELLDDWQELNQLATTLEDTVTQSRFLSQDRLRVFCGTWNMHAKKPTDDLRLWIRPNKYHVVAVGSEECVNSIAKSVVFTSKKSWEDQLRGTLGEDYVLVASHALTAIHNIVFVHTSILPLLGNIQSDAVATGLGNQLGNKGGVGISFTVGTTSFAFINSHFDAHQRNVSKRNGNFHRINHELRLSSTGSISSPTSSVAIAPTPGKTNTENLQGLGRTSANRFSMPTVGAAAPSSKRTISERFDRVFWYGDLNYRINGTRRMVDTLLLRNQHDVLYANDQLQREMKVGNVFARFREGQLHFRPTYKFDKRSDVYDSSSKQRIPSWTDRVLYLSNDTVHDIELLSYRSQTNFRTSDHRPVCAIFQVNFTAAGTVGLLQSPRRNSSNHEDGQQRDNHVSSQACTIQ